MRLMSVGGFGLALFVVGFLVVGSQPPEADPVTASDLPAFHLQTPQAVPLTVWYLGHSGFAVQVGNKLLVFDYQEEYGTPAASRTAGGLEDGMIDPADLQGLDVYVFTSHPHGDHYDPANLEWAQEVDEITYFFGWEADHGPGRHYLAGPRATAEVDGLEVFTINSHHSGVPEVAYLVHVDGRWIYHNGDYLQDYLPDFEYLRTLTDHMDLVFHAGVHEMDIQYGLQAQYLLERFSPATFFPMHYGDEEGRGEEFARIWAERGFDTFIPVPRRRGDRWELGG